MEVIEVLLDEQGFDEFQFIDNNLFVDGFESECEAVNIEELIRVLISDPRVK